MKRSLISGILSIFGLAACGPQPPKPGQLYRLSCPPHGDHNFAILFSSEDGKPTSSDKKAFRWLASNWTSLWPKVDAEFRKIIQEHEYDLTFEALFSNPENTLYIQIKDGEPPDRPYWTIDLDIKMPHGRNIILVCLEGDTIENSETFF